MARLKISEIAKLLSIPHTKAKRYTRELFQPDPEATLQSGRARSLTEQEAYLVYFAHRLVSENNFTVHEAKIVINDLEYWLREIGLFPMDNGKFKSIKSKVESWKIFTFKTDKPFHFVYEAEGVISKTHKDEKLEGEGWPRNLHIQQKEFVHLPYIPPIAHSKSRENYVGVYNVDRSNFKILQVSYWCETFKLQIEGKSLRENVDRWIKHQDLF